MAAAACHTYYRANGIGPMPTLTPPLQQIFLYSTTAETWEPDLSEANTVTKQRCDMVVGFMAHLYLTTMKDCERHSPDVRTRQTYMPLARPNVGNSIGDACRRP